MAFDANDELEQMLNVAKTGVPIRAGMMKVTKSSGDVGHMKAVFEQAFPDQEFELIPGGIRSAGKRAPKPDAVTIPAGFDPRLADAGLRDLQTALERATTDEDKLDIAIKLNSAAQIQKAHKFNEFKRRAESEFGIPELEAAIRQVENAERSSPFNPGTGMPSAQRMSLIESLGIQRVRAANRVSEMIGSDTALVTAEQMAKATLTSIDAKMKLDERTDRNTVRDAQRATREAAISSIDPRFIEGVSILKLGKAPKDAQGQRNIAEQLYDGKIRLSETERLLASADVPTLTNFYIQAKNPKDKALTLQVVLARETAATGDEAQAKINVGLFEKVMNTNLSDPQTRLSPEMKQRLTRANSDATAQAAASGKTKDEMLAQSMVGLKRELLGEVVRQSLYNDLSTWNGLIKSDETAQLVLKQTPKGERLNLQRFISEYIAVNDGKRLPEKSKAMQAIIMSGLGAIPKSEILPIPSEETLMLEAQRMIATAQVRAVRQGAFFAPYNLLTKGIGQ